MFNVANALLTKLVEWVYALIQIFRDIGDATIAWLLNAVAGVIPNSTTTVATINTALGNINYFFPLSETITFCGAFLSLWAIVWGYKAVKSWIPTVSS